MAFNLRKQAKIRDHILKTVHAAFEDEVLSGEMLDAYVRSLRFSLKLPSTSDIAIKMSLLPSVGEKLTPDLGARIATVLAGGISFLRKGISLSMHGVLQSHDAPVEIRSCYPDFLKGRAVYRLSFLVMSGQATGQTIRKAVPRGFLSSLMFELGIPKTKIFKTHFREIVRMWFTASLIGGDSSTVFEEFHCTGGLKKHNDDLRKARNKPCYKDGHSECHLCPVGYLDCDRHLGTHRRSYEKMTCSLFGEPHVGYRDPDIDRDCCVSCMEREHIVGRRDR